ncbi:MAG: YjbH domain-containing protein [Elusimicrobiota bacterium]
MLSALSPKLVIVLIIFYVYNSTPAQTLEGTTGLFFIPTAEMQKDGTVLIGTNFVSKELVSFSGYERDALTPYLTFTFLPFVEFNIKITRLINTNVSTQGIGDRTFSGRIRIIEEKEIIPAIVVGLHDALTVFGGTEAIHNNALYLVGTKNFNIPSNILNNFSIHAGYGLDILQAHTYNFVGLFGGLSINFFNSLELMMEYDGERPNGGFRIKVLNHIKLLAGLMDKKYFSGGAAVSFRL